MQQDTSRGMSVFLTVWIGQLVSVIGTNLTAFALSVWVFERTDSVTQYSFVFLAASLPQILMSPVAGALADRWDRRWVMILSDTGAGLSTLSIALLLFAGLDVVWPIYVVVLVSAVFGTFQWPAYSAATTLLVPKEHYARASGMVDMAQGVAMLIAPVLAGGIMALGGLEPILLIDFGTFLFAVMTLMRVRFPRPEATTEGQEAQGSLRRELTFGWSYIAARRGLLALLILFAIANFFTGIVMALVIPMVLAFASEATLGTVLSIGATGGLIGSIVIGVWGGPQRRVYGVLGFGALFGVGVVLMGLRPSVVLVTLGSVLLFFCLSIISACNQAIWQSKVAPDVQGRVFSVRSMISMSSLPLAYLVAGPLADQLFGPLLEEGGPLADSVGQIVGVGEGRGIALLLIGLGMFTILAVVGSAFYPRLRLVEDELPDFATPESETTAERSEVGEPVPAAS